MSFKPTGGRLRFTRLVVDVPGETRSFSVSDSAKESFLSGIEDIIDLHSAVLRRNSFIRFYLSFMYFATEDHYAPFGIKASQLKYRNGSESGSSSRTISERGSEDNKYESEFFPLNESAKQKNHRWLNAYNGSSDFFPPRNMRGRSLATQHFLCGSLNTGRLSKKSTLSGTSANTFRQLYGSQKPCFPGISTAAFSANQEESPAEPVASRCICKQPSSFTHDNSSPCGKVNQNRHADNYGSVEVPDLVNVDYKETCPLFDGGYAKFAENSPLTGKSGADSLASTPELYYNRYAIFIGEKLSQQFISSQVTEMKCEESNLVARVPREEALTPLLTVPGDNGSFVITEYSPKKN